ncbi:MAG: LLM class flavin-dependent oxidoreductase [Vulcanimicrobiota bacterium]
MSVSFGLTISPELSPSLLLRIARLAEWLGFERLWFPDHLAGLDGSPCADVWSVMATVAMYTRTVELGTAVSDPHRYHPAVLAQRAATLDRLSAGRFILGLGTGEAMNLDPFAIPWGRPLARLREAVQVIRHLLDRTDPLDFAGEFFQIRDARGYKTCRRIPLFLAAVGPRALAYAGEVADGWMPVPVPVECFPSFHQLVCRSAALAGRDPAQVEAVASIAVDWSGEGQPDLSLVWPPVLQAMGSPLILDTDFRRVVPAQQAAYLEQQASLGPELMARFRCSSAQLQQRLHAYAAQGARHFNLNMGSFLDLVQVAARVMPELKNRRATPLARLLQAGAPVLQQLRGWFKSVYPARNVPGNGGGGDR